MYPRVDFCTPGGTFFDPCIFLDSRRSGSLGFAAAELTVHDGSHRLLNVQLFLLATSGTLVVQAFPEGESQTHSRTIRNHSMMVQAKHLQREKEVDRNESETKYTRTAGHRIATSAHLHNSRTGDISERLHLVASKTQATTLPRNRQDEIQHAFTRLRRMASRHYRSRSRWSQ